MIKCILLALSLLAGPAMTETITLASTTSTQNSGLYDHILPVFEADTDIKVRVIAVGTGQALRIARNGDADVLLVHHRPSEEEFVTQGFGIERFDVMFNDFVLIGPTDDPANVRDAKSISDAMERLARSQALFISRGDDSGTHKRELTLWEEINVAPEGAWYREIGAGMGAALNMAAATGAYTLSDRGTWLSFGNKEGIDMLYAGDDALRNPYGLVVVSPAKHKHVKIFEAQKFVKWMRGPKGQEAIGSLRVEGMQLFCPYADGKLPSNAVCPSQ